MNVTIFNSTEELVGQLFLGGTAFSVCSYAIFLCHAIYDYQEEKPIEEKCPIDFLVKDLMHSEFWMLYHVCLVQIISLFSPPITSNVAYLISYMQVFLLNFYQTSFLVLLYIQHVYIFYHNEFVNVDFSIIRRKTIMWKFILTLSSLFLNCLVPSLEVPMAYQILTKGAIYDR